MNCSHYRSPFPNTSTWKASGCVVSVVLRGPRVVRRVGWQGLANDGVRNMNEIYSETSASEAGSRSSSLQLASLSRICSACQGISAAEGKSAAEAFKALCGSAPAYTGNGVMQATFKEGLVSLPDPCSKMADGADLSNWLGLLKLGGIGAGCCFARHASFMKRSRWKGELLRTLTQSSSGNRGVMPDSHVT